MSNLHATVISILQKVKTLNSLSPSKLRGLRSQITRAIEKAEEEGDAKLLDVLNAAQQRVGKGESSGSEPKTAADYVKDYEETYLSKSMGERGGFKAAVTRRMNLAEEEGDSETYDMLEELQERMEEDANRAKVQMIDNLLDDLDLSID